MKILHIADLHLGKSIHGVSLLENGDQPYWADRFLEKVEEIRPDAIVIAGDVFDRSSPSEGALALFSRMLTSINDMKIPVMTVAGNHDSNQRIAYMGPVLSRQGLYFSRSLLESGKDSGGVSPDTRAELTHVTLTDDYGPVTFWLMPYVFPAAISQALGDESLRDYESAVRALIGAQPADYSERNVLIAHQNVTAGGKEGERGGSESMVGGIGQIDYSVFGNFEYVALGHIHAAYSVGRSSVRYAGSPMCYHFDEVRQARKGPLLVTLGEKGSEPSIELIDIEPLHKMRDLRGEYETLRRDELAGTGRGEYIRIVLEDRKVEPEISEFFRSLYRERGSILMELRSDYNYFEAVSAGLGSDAASGKSPGELFSDFYADRRGGEFPGDKDIELMHYADELMTSADIYEEPDEKAVNALIRYLMEQEADK